MKLLIVLTASLACSFANAQSVEPVTSDADFAALNESNMAKDTVYFNYTKDPMSFTDWMRNHPEEYAYLALWNGYKEPTVLSREERKPVVKEQTMFVAKAKAIIDKSPANLKMDKMITEAFLRRLEPDVEPNPIGSDQVMPIVAGRENIDNFTKICGNNVKKPYTEPPLGALQRPYKPWCSDASRSKCFESCYVFSGRLKAGIQFHNTFMAKDDFDKKDYAMASQFELRYFTSDREMETKLPATKLTGINTPVRGVIEQNVFYFNQMVQYGKVVSFFQEKPGDTTKTIVTSYMVFGIQTPTYNKSRKISKKLEFKLSDVIMGRVEMLRKDAKGLALGLPDYTKGLAVAFIKAINEN